MASYVGPNGRLYQKKRKRWPILAVAAALLTVTAVTVNVMRPATAVTKLEQQR